MALYYVRLKPWNKLKGNVKITWRAPWGIRYYQGKWVPHDDALGNNAECLEYLRTKVHQIDTDPSSPLAFDVCTPAEKLALTASEYRSEAEIAYKDGVPPEQAPTEFVETRARRQVMAPPPKEDDSTAEEEKPKQRRKLPRPSPRRGTGKKKTAKRRPRG